MVELQRVPLDHPPPPNWLPALGTVLALLLAVAIVKPWPDADSPEATTAVATPTAIPDPTGRAPRSGSDPRLVGAREPEPAWELWPAGYVIEFGIAGPVRVEGQDEPGASPSPGRPGPSVSPAAPPTHGTVPGATPGPDEHVVDLGPADHLVALGINTPADVRVEAMELWLVLDAGAVRMPIVRLPTPWNSRHFLVIAVADPVRPSEPGAWPAGEYRLDLQAASGEVRQVRMRVTAPLD